MASGNNDACGEEGVRLAHSAQIKNSPTVWGNQNGRLRKMYIQILTQAQALVKYLRYKPKHRNEWWDRDLTDNQRAWLGILTGLMLGWAIFSSIAK